MMQKLLSLWSAAVIVAVLMMMVSMSTACGCGDDDDDDDSSAGGDDDDDDISSSGDCDVEPICSAFFNDGGEGGELNVAIDSEGEYAIVETNSLAEHPMGPFAGGLEYSAQDLTFYIPLEPAGDPGTETPLGPMAVAYNGVALYNPWDATEVDGCSANAFYFRAVSFDDYGGHPQDSGQYHYHVGAFLNHADDLGLENSLSGHSPILGYSFDGYPIYGPYGYSDPENADSPIQLLESCYAIVDERTCCTNDSTCGTDAEYLGLEAVLGAWIEDYEFDAGALEDGDCDLNEYNMRFQVTPEYPEGTWAYIMTIKDGTPVYPYIIGMTYYGEPSESGEGGPPAR
ncbi:MAG: YHYH protein [Deltaproteobacteria bacterium]|nr:YHYH protein [bacterium]MCB9477570.1 YHYH protein [Deltaproteobacteria bacterium]MCB9487670.1 YHYH protein [Deltaproteobacteria bacterium]